MLSTFKIIKVSGFLPYPVLPNCLIIYLNRFLAENSEIWTHLYSGLLTLQ